MPCANGVFLQGTSDFRHHSHQTSLDVCEMNVQNSKVHVGNDQEKAQSERNSHSKIRGGKLGTYT